MTFLFVRRTAFQEEQRWGNERPFVEFRIRARENLDMHANHPAAGRSNEGKGDRRERIWPLMGRCWGPQRWQRW